MRCSLRHRLSNNVFGAVAGLDLSNPLTNRSDLPGRCRGHVGPPQGVPKLGLLICPFNSDTAATRLDTCAGVIRDQGTQPLAGTAVTQELGAVDWVKSDPLDIRRVADIVQPRRGDQ